ncbi:M35 family metallo-endopeptidase [Variovorax sp. NFACC27]|uniref:M35 family metallo-endopeptidase n=1 Tax=unclassified Variovorax TaxID=663243 RepID=UPI00089556C7|nr:Lysine-specific metallo-endopeptidase [Variovorax sp. NFACC28]SEF60976.1 Lysine-specific metallo-endopeptidase [Variovorax sp. NFACC29]SFB72598.1 Lysine-specific metallo-endopeptidase [Variovorax sp. NFACC26]SFG56657.1 Lysine-specific metallo-endopeptidase [Variovorax sp. NFACC27]
MMRRVVLVGDLPAAGGRVLPYEGPMVDFFGHRPALIGGRAYCEGCNSVGIIAKAGGPRRPQFISEIALEGDVVVCHCPVPQPLLSGLRQSAEYDDEAWRASGTMPTMAPTEDTTSGLEMAAFKKIVDEGVTHPPEAEQTENICPNMTNKEFAALMMRLRDTAIDYITKKRLPELERWDKRAQAHVKTWFGVADHETREYLRKGLAGCVRTLKGLEPKNFVRFTESGRLATCVMGSSAGTVAAVCKPDTATHTIAIALPFCTFEWDNKTHFETGEVMNGDSKLLTLIHEITHFDDTFSSNDEWYGTMISKLNAMNARNRAKARVNADSIAAYILGIDQDTAA